MTSQPGDILNKLLSTQESLRNLIPEWVLTIGLLIITLAGLLFTKVDHQKKRNTIFILTILLFLTSALSYLLVSEAPASGLFNNMLVDDTFSRMLKVVFDLSGMITICMSFQKNSIKSYFSEYCVLLMTAILGAHILVMSTNFVMLFISLEMISIPSYVLAGYSFQQAGSEGSLKYFLFGAVASSIMLYGMSLLYGITGTLTYTDISFASGINGSSLSILAFILIAAGILFKVAAVPMHIWVPDIYEASPIPVVAFFSVVPKLAGLGILTRFTFTIQSFPFNWSLFLSCIALITIMAGNLAALKQSKVKRLMAYSSIAQSGFMIIGIVTMMPEGIHFMIFYAIVYAIANYLIFIYLQEFENKGITTVEEFAGTGKQNATAHIFLLVALISLAGLPPTAGFTGKLFLFSALWSVAETSDNTLIAWLFTLGLLNTVIALFYYIKIPFFAFLKERPTPISINNTVNLFGFIFVVGLMILFFLPFLLMSWINKITFVF